MEHLEHRWKSVEIIDEIAKKCGTVLEQFWHSWRSFTYIVDLVGKIVKKFWHSLLFEQEP